MWCDCHCFDRFGPENGYSPKSLPASLPEPGALQIEGKLSGQPVLWLAGGCFSVASASAYVGDQPTGLVILANCMISEWCRFLGSD
ncbi:hypothetical protein SV7mr_00980 [Stieleria bergensis]|uniref:Uncharacterized protein n=1 Tax=Stieleria bergensis TaxID=2528025 RepID=A0A517SNB4_9BACT|nr:hypothetical protein SV7mr_00980 [Planctomycetes bacterium SV_7m_r]